MNENVDLSKLHKSTLECNLNYWIAIEKEADLKIKVACKKQLEIYHELLKRKENTNDQSNH